MNTKLTLTVDGEVIEKAKNYARSEGRSLSDIIENYLKFLTREDENTDVEITPLVRSLQGSFKAPGDFDYKKQLSQKLSEKYL